MHIVAAVRMCLTAWLLSLPTYVALSHLARILSRCDKSGLVVKLSCNCFLEPYSPSSIPGTREKPDSAAQQDSVLVRTQALFTL